MVCAHHVFCRCQDALESKALDAVETAYQKTKQAEERAAEAANTAAVAAANAAVNEHNARHHTEISKRSADLSMPHGVIEKIRYSVTKGRRGVVHAARAVQQETAAMINGVMDASAMVRRGVGERMEWLKGKVQRELQHFDDQKKTR